MMVKITTQGKNPRAAQHEARHSGSHKQLGLAGQRPHKDEEENLKGRWMHGVKACVLSTEK